MVYIFKTGRTDMTPADMCALSEAGNYAPTGATEWSFMTSGAWQLGLNGTQLYNDRDSMAQVITSCSTALTTPTRSVSTIPIRPAVAPAAGAS